MKNIFSKAAKLLLSSATIYLAGMVADLPRNCSAQTAEYDRNFSPFTSSLGAVSIEFGNLRGMQYGDQKYLFLPKGIVTDFYLSWRKLAKQNSPISDSSAFEEWEEKSQQEYLYQLVALAKKMPENCHQDLSLCPDNSPYVKKANDLNSHYKISSALGKWDAARMARAYIAALMDPEIGEAARNWENLSRIEKIEIGKKLISYQFLAYKELTQNYPFPIFEIVEKLPNARAETISRLNKFVFSGDDFDKIPAWDAFGIFWHEGRHRISAMLRDALHFEAGALYLKENGILTDIEINLVNNSGMYSNGDRKDTTYEIMLAQAEEATSVYDERFGNVLGARLLDKNTPDHIPAELAKRYLEADITNPANPFAMAMAANHLHDIFKKDWENICYGVEDSMLETGLLRFPPNDGCDGPWRNKTSPAKPLTGYQR